MNSFIKEQICKYILLNIGSADLIVEILKYAYNLGFKEVAEWQRNDLIVEECVYYVKQCGCDEWLKHHEKRFAEQSISIA